MSSGCQLYMQILISLTFTWRWHFTRFFTKLHEDADVFRLWTFTWRYTCPKVINCGVWMSLATSYKSWWSSDISWWPFNIFIFMNCILTYSHQVINVSMNMQSSDHLCFHDRDVIRSSTFTWACLCHQVINFYMNMLMERGEQEGFSKTYAFNTFFYPKLISGGHAAVKRWTRKVDIFAHQYLVIPVHLGVHWCLCVRQLCVCVCVCVCVCACAAGVGGGVSWGVGLWAKKIYCYFFCVYRALRFCVVIVFQLYNFVLLFVCNMQAVFQKCGILVCSFCFF